ncbi:UDP-N-acetylglucosamine--LPS N-acetylglucosamine transferase [Pseudooceanicola onchidii]|uniref:UDP-N-acetylglucosamine--LPS N-acetylglucosamine transferase n=1 Tax=Pseudooceanicola onchidii TaxID=2562279 RepID=UPI0010AA0996|nr:UDP-N-acetylglucosamine--LPS N-acetylglucosamine transferase [Pseudooceanicola onchidii]
MKSATGRPRRILAIASGGGHWQQLMLLRPAFEGHEVLFATTLTGLAAEFDAHPYVTVPDCNRNKKIAILRSAATVTTLILWKKPDIVISTGALPGVIALAIGRLIGARTVWIDSIANAEEMSMSGKLARRFAHLWLSQWEHVAAETGADFAGAVL